MLFLVNIEVVNKHERRFYFELKELTASHKLDSYIKSKDCSDEFVLTICNILKRENCEEELLLLLKKHAEIPFGVRKRFVVACMSSFVKYYIPVPGDLLSIINIKAIDKLRVYSKLWHSLFDLQTCNAGSSSQETVEQFSSGACNWM